MTLEKLAQMVARGFQDMYERLDDGFDSVYEKMYEIRDELSTRIDHLESKIEGINNRLDDLALNRTTRDEHFLLVKRVDRIEKKIGLKSK